MNQLERLQKVLRARNDPEYFLTDPYFIGDFEPWPLQKQLFCEFYNGHYKELDAAGGQGAGKSALGSLFLARDCFDVLIREDPAKDYGLSSHSLIMLYAIAKSIDQAADTVFAEMCNRMQAPFFQEYQPRIREFDITFRKHPDVEVAAGGAVSAGSLMGRNVKSEVLDEITSWDETQSQRGAWQVYSRLRKSTNRFGFDGHVIAISMCWHVNDIIMTLVKQKDPHTMTKVFATWEMNPTKAFDSPEMIAERNRDELTFWRDYGVQPHASIEGYYRDKDVIRINPERPNLLDILDKDVFIATDKTYILSIDPSIDNCYFGIALMSLEGEKVVCDGLKTLKPHGAKELNPIEVKDSLIKICKNYPVSHLITDVWFYNEALLEIKNLGVEVLFKPLRKEEHDAVKNAFYDRKLELCPHEGIIEEFSQLLILDSKRIGVVRKGHIDTVHAITRGFWGVQTLLLNRTYPVVAVEVI